MKGWNVHAQLYAADGTALTGEVVVASSNDDETAPAVAIGDDGRFVVAWQRLGRQRQGHLRAGLRRHGHGAHRRGAR